MKKSETFSGQLREPNEIGRLTPWDLDFRQISSGQGQTPIRVRSGHLLTAMFLRMECRVHQVGTSPEGMVTFGVPLSGNVSKWQGSKLPSDFMICFGSGHEFEGVSESGFSAVTVSLAQADFETVASDFGLDMPEYALHADLLDLSSRCNLAKLMAVKAAQYSGTQAEEADLGTDEELALTLCLSTSNARALGNGGTANERSKVLRRAMEIIEAESEGALTIRVLCKLCETSWSTLHRSFVDQFGMGPKAYLNALRLNRVRAELLHAAPGTRVFDAANRWGFWHMGQFARDYQNLFKCRPSDDLCC